MTAVGVYLNDAGLAVTGQDQSFSVMPSIVHSDPANFDSLGSSARHVARLTPRAVSVDHWTTLTRAGLNITSSARSIIQGELRARLADRSVNTPLQCAVPAVFGPDSLSVVLALMRREGFNVHAFHDAASLMVASAGLGGTTIVLEMGLGHFSATRVDSDQEVRRRASTTRYGAGVLALHQCWLQRIAEAMVLQTRFDPLHDGMSEQRLYDDLEKTYSTAASEGAAEIGLSTPNGVVRVTLSRDQFAEAASSIYSEALAVLHELRPAGSRTNLLLDEQYLQLPGFLERLASLRGCRVFVHSTGFASRAAAAEQATFDADGSVTIHRGHVLRPPLEMPKEIDLSDYQSANGLSPTHALVQGTAVEILQGVLEVGRNPQGRGLRLGEGLAGVSRLHCYLQCDESRVTLVPHSTQGTWLNDERVSGRVRVSSGDQLRIGSPGVVIELIAVGGGGRGASS